MLIRRDVSKKFAEINENSVRLRLMRKIAKRSIVYYQVKFWGCRTAFRKGKFVDETGTKREKFQCALSYAGQSTPRSISFCKSLQNCKNSVKTFGKDPFVSNKNP